MASSADELDDGEVYTDSDPERKMKKKRRHDDSPLEIADDENEEARLRARLLARQAEKERDKGKKSDKHHHKKKKKRRDSSPSSVGVVEQTTRIVTTTTTTTENVVDIVDIHHGDDDLEEGLNIQPPQLPTSSMSASASSGHRKKHKKKDKHRNEDEFELERFRHKERKEERIEIVYDLDDKKERRAREGWAAWQRSLGPTGPPRGSAPRGPPSIESKPHSWIERERRKERIEKTVERYRPIDDPGKLREDAYARREKHRGDERIRRSRSPADRRPRRQSPNRGHHERKFSPQKDLKHSREGRWLPQVNRETASDRSSSVTKSVEKGAVPSKERNLNPPRIKVTEPSHSASSISPIDRVVLETTAEIVQQSTPTQDELEDKETEVLSAVSKTGSSDSESNQSSSSSSPNATDEGESLESGERRSENSDDRRKKGAPREYYSKFDSSPEVEDGLSDREDVTLELEDHGEPEPIVSDDEVEKALDNGVVEPITPEMENKEEREPDLPIYYPATMGCRYVEEFDCLNRIEEGTYGVVYRAKEKRTNEIVALKRLKMEKEKEGFPITSLREINMLLKAGNHANIVNVREIVVGSNMDKIYLVMDYVEHDLKSLMETMKQPFLVGEVKTLLKQLLSGVHHLHDNWILHRDLKTSNLLLSHKGILKIGDFGLAREYGSPLKPYTPIVVTLWYRAPELLLGTKEYSTKIDVWSVGSIFAELLTLKPLFTGKSEIEQLNKMFKMLGTPNNKIWEGYDELPGVKKMQFVEYPYNSLRKHFGATLSDKGFNLLNKLLTYDPVKRITAKSALMDEWFEEEPRPVHPEMFPTWPAKSELSKTARKSSPKPPSGGKQYKQMGESDKDLLAGLRVKPVHGNQTAGFSLKFDAPKFR